ncbi:restriction endonuclease subunit S [uncultured Pseudoalteromonas sp.]|uniref:restriction endonuclease subunit S n=1 Tax=uncultured Pseudoalteromonas sp. TaxID=114053 RepID=UPI0025982D16|nr:restriction endonuclease subunit S [uncultured Pseudoalteromonas sp.]
MSWSLVKLGDICTTTQGVQITKANTKEEPYQGGYRYLYIADFMSEKKLSFVDDEFDHKKVTSNDLVMANTGSPGRVFKGKDGILSNNLFKISFDNNSVDRDYLYMMLSSNVFQSLLQKQMKGGIQKHLGHQTISRQEIPLPPLEEQKRIAAILDKADAIRRKRQQAIQLADDFLRSVFLDMFGDPVTNPKGWEVRRFSELCKCSQGMQVDSKLQKDSAENGYVKFLRIINYTQSSNEFKFIPTPSTDKALIKRDDIVMVRYGATAGFVGRGLGGVLANNLFKISFEKSVLDNEYFYYLLNSDYFQNILRSNKKGGAMPAISFGQLNDIEIMIPSLQEQSKFSQVVNIISNIKGHSIGSAFLSDDSFDALSQAAFSGEL